jgi:hypothetical protein
LWPIGLKMASDGSASVPVAPVENADYVAVVVKTDVLTVLGEGGTIFNVGIAFKFADELSEWSGGVTVDDGTDFLPVFADTTEYTAGGVINWSLSDKVAVDAYVAIAIAVDGTVGIALLPGTDDTFDAATAFGYTPNSGGTDTVILVGVDLPAGVDINEFDPTSLLTYDSAAVNVWTNFDLSGIIPSN